MKYIFVVNPKAGQGTGIQEFTDEIKRAAEETQTDCEIYMTKCVGDAEVFARGIGEASKESGEDIRLIACGGDGTVNEVLNGAISYDNLSVGAVPMGTGNDFVRNFPEAGDFKSPKAFMLGDIVKCDCIRYRGMLDGREQTRYCANMFNIGFDCNVVDMTAEMKKKPLISGSFAYLLSVAGTLIGKKGASLKITADGKTISDGDILLTSVANGQYCGGGIRSNPYALMHDGKIDISVINMVGRIKFISLFPSYSKGTHIGKKAAEGIVMNQKADHVEITPLSDKARLCTDGEIVDMSGTIEFDGIKDGFRLVLPAKQG